MRTHFLGALLPAVLAGACALPLAHADIYTWTDDSGRVNLSNLTPPEGANATRVVQESVPKAASRNEAARDALRDAEVQVLAERVRQLQYEVELAKRPLPQQVEYRAIPAPPIIQYFAPPEVQYAVAAPPMSGGCDFGYMDCGLGWGPGFYPVSYVMAGLPQYRGGHTVRGDGSRWPRQPFPGSGHTAPWAPIYGPGRGRGH